MCTEGVTGEGVGSPGDVFWGTGFEPVCILLGREKVALSETQTWMVLESQAGRQLRDHPAWLCNATSTAPLRTGHFKL